MAAIGDRVLMGNRQVLDRPDPPADAPTGRWYAPAPMFSRVKVAIRFFFVGLVVGVLLAPRSGRATRRLLRVRADRLFNELLDAATLGAYETKTGSLRTRTTPIPPRTCQPSTRKKAARLPPSPDRLAGAGMR